MTENENKLTVNDKEYDVSDLTDREIYVLNQVKNLRQRIANARFELDQMVMAENAFAKDLVDSLTKEKESDVAWIWNAQMARRKVS